MRTPLLAAVLSATALLVPQTPTEKQAGPEVGQHAPAIRLNDHDGNIVSVGDAGDRWTVLAFYPKALTPGCTREVCSLRDAATGFEELAVDVYGISFDSVAMQARFAKEQELNFRLLSDPDGSAAKKYDVHAGGFSKRVTFVIDEKGNLRHIEADVQVDSHGEDLMELVYKLQTE